MRVRVGLPWRLPQRFHALLQQAAATQVQQGLQVAVAGQQFRAVALLGEAFRDQAGQQIVTGLQAVIFQLRQLFAQLQQLFAVLPGRLAVALRIKSL